MKISTKGRYALRLMIDLGLNNKGDYITLRDISERQNISIKYLEQIVTQLCKSGFVKSLRGPQGGYMLSDTPKNYKVGDILRIFEGKLAPVSCLETPENQCQYLDKCTTVEFWTGFYNVINNYIDSVTLEDLIDKAKKKI